MINIIRLIISKLRTKQGPVYNQLLEKIFGTVCYICTNITYFWCNKSKIGHEKVCSF